MLRIAASSKIGTSPGWGRERGMKRDIEELVRNLRAWDPDTYWMCAGVALCLWSLVAMIEGRI